MDFVMCLLMQRASRAYTLLMLTRRTGLGRGCYSPEGSRGAQKRPPKEANVAMKATAH